MQSGWIHLHRRLLENPWVKKDNDYLAVWIHLLLFATHQERVAVFEGQQITLQPGQLLTGREFLAQQCGVNEYKVQRILKVFENAQQITQQTTPRGRLVTIVNWEKYQLTKQPSAQQAHNKRTTNAQQAHAYKNVKNERKKETTPRAAAEVVDKFELAAQAFLQYWNEVHGTKYHSYKPIMSNLEFWLGQYQPDEIKEAVVNIKSHPYWKSAKMTPHVFLRQKNQRNEQVDYIADLLHRGGSNAAGEVRNIK